MINFRYHIVSITAVFLALGIGAALGSTFLDQATVDRLDQNIRSAENRIRDTDGENARLQADVERSEDRDANLILFGAPELFGEQLTDVPVLVVVAPGVDGSTVDAVRFALDASGADFRGSLQLSSTLAFPGDDVDSELVSDLGLPARTGVAELRTEAFDQLQRALQASGAPAPAPPGDLEQPAAITALLARGYLRFDPPAGGDAAAPVFGEPDHRYVFVTGPGLEASDNDVLLGLLPADPELAPPAVVVSVTEPPVDPEDDDEIVPSVVRQIRDREDLRALYDTVDDIDTFSGLLATMLVVERLGDGAPGHYGQGEGASAVLPAAP